MHGCSHIRQRIPFNSLITETPVTTWPTTVKLSRQFIERAILRWRVTILPGTADEKVHRQELNQLVKGLKHSAKFYYIDRPDSHFKHVSSCTLELFNIDGQSHDRRDTTGRRSRFRRRHPGGYPLCRVGNSRTPQLPLMALWVNGEELPSGPETIRFAVDMSRRANIRLDREAWRQFQHPLRCAPTASRRNSVVVGMSPLRFVVAVEFSRSWLTNHQRIRQ